MANIDWFNEARYGMFIHWGAYSVAARGEWLLNRERTPYDEYIRQYVKRWKAQRYDPRQWVRLAKEAGMKYMVLTTRHHDGFALWDTQTNDFNAAKMGPKRDLVAEFAQAVREGGLKVGFYYSAADWRHEDYPFAYARDWPSEKDWKSEEARKRFIEYNRAQIRELLTNYGQVDILWYDGCIPTNLDGGPTNEMARQLQPHILINDRNGKPWDFKDCEQAINPAPAGTPWEACMTLNSSWGYHAGDNDYKSPKSVLDMLITTAASGGNLLLNVGPKADGTIPPRSAKILQQAGQWLARNREFLANSERSPLSWNNCSKVTVKGNRVYLHILLSPGKTFCLAELKNKVLAARFLASGQAIDFRQENGRLFLTSAKNLMTDSPVTTIVLDVEGTPAPATPRTTFWIPG